MSTEFRAQDVILPWSPENRIWKDLTHVANQRIRELVVQQRPAYMDDHHDHDHGCCVTEKNKQQRLSARSSSSHAKIKIRQAIIQSITKDHGGKFYILDPNTSTKRRYRTKKQGDNDDDTVTQAQRSNHHLNLVSPSLDTVHEYLHRYLIQYTTMDQLHPMDVLSLGARSRILHVQPGNCFLKYLVDQYRSAYELADRKTDTQDEGTGKRNQTDIVDEIYACITFVCGGKFLERWGRPYNSVKLPAAAAVEEDQEEDVAASGIRTIWQEQSSEKAKDRIRRELKKKEHPVARLDDDCDEKMSMEELANFLQEAIPMKEEDDERKLPAATRSKIFNLPWNDSMAMMSLIEGKMVDEQTPAPLAASTVAVERAMSTTNRLSWDNYGADKEQASTFEEGGTMMMSISDGDELDFNILNLESSLCDIATRTLNDATAQSSSVLWDDCSKDDTACDQEERIVTSMVCGSADSHGRRSSQESAMDDLSRGICTISISGNEAFTSEEEGHDAQDETNSMFSSPMDPNLSKEMERLMREFLKTVTLPSVSVLPANSISNIQNVELLLNEYKTEIGRVGGMEYVVKLMQDPTASEALQRDACWILAQFVSDGHVEDQDRMRSTGALQCVVSAMKRYPTHQNVLSKACLALAWSSASDARLHEENQRYIGEIGGVDCIVHTLCAFRRTEVLVTQIRDDLICNASEALGNVVANNPFNQNRIEQMVVMQHSPIFASLLDEVVHNENESENWEFGWAIEACAAGCSANSERLCQHFEASFGQRLDDSLEELYRHLDEDSQSLLTRHCALLTGNCFFKKASEFMKLLKNTAGNISNPTVVLDSLHEIETRPWSWLNGKGSLLAPLVIKCMNQYKDKEEQVQIHVKGCHAIARLAISLPALIGESGGVEVIGNAMRLCPSNRPVQRNAILALVELCPNGLWVNQFRIGRSGCLECIVAAMQRFPKDEIIQRYACEAFIRLAGNETHFENQMRIATIGGIESVVQAMKSFRKNEEMQEKGCSVFRVLLDDDHASNQIRIGLVDGGIQSILDAMKAFPRVSAIQETTILLMKQLSDGNVMNQNIIGISGGIRLLIQSMQLNPHSDKIRFMAQNALSSLLSIDAENNHGGNQRRLQAIMESLYQIS